MTVFWRCCCSGVASALTLIPVISSNSDRYLSNVSLRGLFTRLTSSVSPENFFQSTSAEKAGLPPKSAAAPKPAVPARNSRLVGLNIFVIVSSFCFLSLVSPDRSGRERPTGVIGPLKSKLYRPASRGVDMACDSSCRLVFVASLERLDDPQMLGHHGGDHTHVQTRFGQPDQLDL